MIQINKQLSLSSGLSIASGVVAQYKTSFEKSRNVNNDGMDYTVNFYMSYYKSLSDYESGMSNISGVLGIDTVYSRVMSEAEYNSLFTEQNSGDVVEGWLIGLIDADLGGSYCIAVSPYAEQN